MRLLIFLSLVIPLPLLSQDTTIIHKLLEISRTDEKIQIDGLAKEASWAQANIATEFIQTSEGVSGEPSTERTEVKMMYSDLGIYIFAANYCTEVTKMSKELSQRDNFGNVDWFVFKVDSYKSELRGEIFGVTSVGVQYDAIDQRFYEDGNWDAVWESQTSFDDKGWYVEMFIPYSALRFPSKPVQEWNINFYRSIRYKREVASWNPLNPEVNGEFTQFGVLKGIKNIKTPTRLSITPFLATSLTNNGFNKDFFSTRSLSGGLDLKYGINDAFTLDMTVIPDFSQARSDQQVLNLSPFEVRFDENRSFFTEGVELFEKGNIFYSRRIGNRHFNLDRLDEIEGEYDSSYDSKPQIINSSKISGRTNKGLGIGFLNSIENRSFAEITYADNKKERILINPLTNYNIIVADQQFKNSSSASITNTNVWREGKAYDANVTSGSLELNNKKQTMGVSAKGQYSQKMYEDEANENGHAFYMRLEKTSGKFTGGVSYNEESDTYDPNDFGFLYNNNSRNFSFDAHYFEYKSEKFNRYGFNMWGNYNMLYEPNVFTDASLGANYFAQTKKVFTFGTWGNIFLSPSRDYFEARTDGRVFVEQNRWNVSPWISTDYRKALAIDLNMNFGGRLKTDRNTLNVGANFRYRFSDRFKVSTRTNYNIEKKDIGYVNIDENSIGYSTLADDDIIFGTRRRLTVSNNLGISYIFNNNMSLTFDARHYWSKVNYDSFNLLAEDGSLSPTLYTGYSNENEKLHDLSFNFFTVDFVYKWRFSPGSDLFFIWKTNIFTEADAQEKYSKALSTTLKEQGTNTFTVKALYYLDYSNLMGKIQQRSKGGGPRQ